jgi:GrpB-like predicted nucleotidyltransferase (UPF0157 family)
METPEQQIQRLVSEEVVIVPYDPLWPEIYSNEKEHLLSSLPDGIIRRIEHFGSTAIPGLAAKPIVDMLVEVMDLAEVRNRIVPILLSKGYEYLWRPTHGDDGPPFYAWFIKRDPATNVRTHHIHMVECSFNDHWDRLYFRDYLIENPDIARQYEKLKIRLSAASATDRVTYTRGKTEFIARVTKQAKQFYGKLSE